MANAQTFVLVHGAWHGGWCWGRVVDLLDAKRQMLMMAGCVNLVGLSEGMWYWRLAGELLLIGAGIGLTVPAMTSALLSTADKSQSGIASGVLNAGCQAAVGVALFGSFIGQQKDLVPGLRLALLVSAGMLLRRSW